jgi:hypothetical protein
MILHSKQRKLFWDYVALVGRQFDSLYYGSISMTEIVALETQYSNIDRLIRDAFS